MGQTKTQGRQGYKKNQAETRRNMLLTTDTWVGWFLLTVPFRILVVLLIKAIVLTALWLSECWTGEAPKQDVMRQSLLLGLFCGAVIQTWNVLETLTQDPESTSSWAIFYGATTAFIFVTLRNSEKVASVNKMGARLVLIICTFSNLFLAQKTRELTRYMFQLG